MNSINIKKILLHGAALCSILHLTSSCGLRTHSNSDQRTFPEPKSGALVPKKPSTVKLSGPLWDYTPGTATNARTFNLISQFVPGEDIGPEDPLNPLALVPKVKVSVFNPKGEVIWDKTQHFKEIKWEVPLAESGALMVQVESISPEGKSETLLKKVVDADFTSPKIVLTSLIMERLDNGDRPLDIKVQVADEKEVRCPTADVQLLGMSQKVQVSLDPVPQIQGSQDPFVFQGKLFLKDQSLKGTPLVSVQCTDRAGNTLEVREPARAQRSSYKLALDAKGPTALVSHSSGDLLATFLKTSELDLNLALLEGGLGTKVSDSLFQTIKEEFAFYLTDKLPENLDELSQNKNILWTQPLDRMVAIKLPPQMSDLNVLYVSLVHKDPVAGQDLLVSSIKVPVFIDKVGPKVSLETKTSLQKAQRNTPIELAAKVEVEGAPLKNDGVSVEVSTDGKVWTNVPTTLQVNNDVTTLTFGYPFGDETTLRARVRAVDVAGSEGVSQISGLLVGFDPKNLSTSAADRSSCRAGAADGALLKPWLASRFLCRKDDGKGGFSPTQHAVLVVQNRGLVAPVFYQSQSVKAGLGYKVLVNGAEVYDNRLEPPTAFTLGTTEYLVFHLPLQEGWLSQDLVEVQWDVESSGANSTTNSCYEPSKPYGAVTIVDKAKGLAPTVAPFACGLDQKFSYMD